MTTHDDAARAMILTEMVKPLLAGEDPNVQSAALADLLALWLAGHPNFVREDLLAAHIGAVEALVSINEKILFGDAGHPQNDPA